MPEKVDIVVANSWNAFAFAGRGNPVIAIEHHSLCDTKERSYKTTAQAIFHATLVRHFQRQSALKASCVVAVSRHTAEGWRRCFGGLAPIVIYNGVDTDYFCPGRSQCLDMESDVFRLLFVGKPSLRKGVDLLPEIMTRLGPGFQLRCVGCRTLPKALREHPRIRLAGRISREALRSEYRGAQALLAPSRLEGFGLAAAEAMSCGTPVVASDAHAFRELIQHEQTGLLCELNNVDDFVQKIHRLAADREHLGRLSDMSRIWAVEHFSHQRMAKQYLGLFWRVLSEVPLVRLHS
jgi:glycosyltransferase involved in cell wall biosynthesis